MTENQTKNMTQQRGRYLLETFFKDLETGFLAPILHEVQSDNSLCFQIRENYINIYYRGGNLLKVSDNRNGTYTAYFCEEYFKNQAVVPLPKPTLSSKADAIGWIALFPVLKHTMDIYFTVNSNLEREAQQLLVRENNIGKGAGSTDYFICDIEYAESGARYDMIAVKWRSTSAHRKNTNSAGLAFIEMKYSDQALTGKCGLQDHLKDINAFLSQPAKIEQIKQEMLRVFNKLKEYGFIDIKKCLTGFDPEEKPEYIFVLANHDPASQKLLAEINGISSFENFDLKFAASNFMGYGLYEQNMFSKAEFLKRFEGHI